MSIPLPASTPVINGCIALLKHIESISFQNENALLLLTLSTAENQQLTEEEISELLSLHAGTDDFLNVLKDEGFINFDGHVVTLSEGGEMEIMAMVGAVMLSNS